jgi:hypothetical protein
MVRIVAVCVMGVVFSVAGCKGDASQTASKVAPLASARPLSATSDGEFRFTQIDGVPMVGWYAPDGKQVILMRVDSRWVCDLSSGQLRCGPKQAATTPCANCLLSASCPCADARCLPMCVANSAVVTGLHDSP